METFNVVIADDHPIVLLGVRELVERDRRFNVVGEALCPDGLIELLKSQPVDLLITDFNMPGMNGIEVMQEMLAIHPALKTAIASGFVDEALTEAAREAGVNRLIFKESAVEDFCAVIRALIEETS